MKKQFIITLLSLSLIGTIATAQTKKPTTTKKPSTTVKSTAPKTTTKTSTTTTTTIPNSTTAPVVVEEKKTTTTTTTTSSPNQSNSSNMNSNGSSNSTTIQQSSGPSKGNKRTADPKPDKVATPKPERVREPRPERVREPRPEKVKSASNSSDGGVRFGIRAEATQLYTLQSLGSFDISPGINAGLIVNLPISSSISIQPEVLYSMTTGKLSIDANNYEKATSGNILVPLMFNINLGQGPTKFMLNLGGYGSYLLNQNYKLVAGGVTQQDGSLDLTNADKFDYGAAIGLGVKINGNFMIEARSFYGLKDNTNSKIGIGTIGIGYFF